MNTQEQKKVSMFLSYILRHQPQAIDLQLDSAGWADIDELIVCASNHGTALKREDLLLVVQSNDKQRFAISPCATRIRANQGHSLDIDLALAPRVPPSILLHGTAQRFVDTIKTQGLQKMQRHHVHLTKDAKIAMAVGARYGKPVLLHINAASMHAQGYVFYLSQNGVWLVDSVPFEFISQV